VANANPGQDRRSHMFGVIGANLSLRLYRDRPGRTLETPVQQASTVDEPNALVVRKIGRAAGFPKPVEIGC
jgi:hypothetical protein